MGMYSHVTELEIEGEIFTVPRVGDTPPNIATKAAIRAFCECARTQFGAATAPAIAAASAILQLPGVAPGGSSTLGRPYN